MSSVRRRIPAAEPIEPRRLLSSSLSAGVLTVTGTTGNDVVAISVDRVNPAKLKVSEGGVVKRFDRAAVNRIVVKLLAGHDYFSLSDGIATPASVLGSGGRDTLIGGAGNDTLDGGEADDVIDGRTGNDRLLGGPGSDEIAGGPGRDTLSYEYALSTFIFGGSRVEYGVVVSLDGLRNDREAVGEDVLDTTIENVTGTSFRDEIVGNGAANVLTGLGGGDSIVGNAGDDYIDGGRGIDTLSGGSGNDTIVGGDGGDRIFGNGGVDRLLGNAGADTFTSAERGAGEVVDFLVGTDILI